MGDQVTLKPMTADDLRELEASGKCYEIRQGVLQEKEMATKGHGRIETNLLLIIGNYARAHDLGRVYPGDTTYVVEGTKHHVINGLLPDVSFIAAHRESDLELDDYHYIAPDLAIEIISSSERAGEIAAKVKTYLKFGTRQVWNVYPDLQQVTVHLPDGTSKTYEIDSTLTGGDLLPGLALKISEIFV